MKEPNETPEGRLPEYLLGDLAPARRHLALMVDGIHVPTRGALEEISAAIERCVRRIERDMW